jgi:pyruvate dehydrogenase E1 component alpha subunit
MPGFSVDGMDVEAVRAAAVDAVNRARAGEGPTFLEIRTYRYFGHGASDHRPYRTRDEEQEWWKKDPVAGYRMKLIAEGSATEAELTAIDDEITKEVAEGVAFAEASPDPKPAESNLYVYTEE